MVKKTVKGELKNALELDPGYFLEELKKRLTEARLMVWEIVETKHFGGFKDAKNLIDAYDHLNKVISVFESYQLPLPGIDETPKNTKDGKQTEMSVVGD
jgi:phage-related tail protein